MQKIPTIPDNIKEDPKTNENRDFDDGFCLFDKSLIEGATKYRPPKIASMLKVISAFILLAKLRIIREVSKEYFKVIDFEDAAVANLAALAGGKYLYVPPTSVKIVSQGDAITEFEYAPIRLPHV